jgi:hypothetical protein
MKQLPELPRFRKTLAFDDYLFAAYKRRNPEAFTRRRGRRLPWRPARYEQRQHASEASLIWSIERVMRGGRA